MSTTLPIQASATSDSPWDFAAKLAGVGRPPLARARLETLQVNVGKRCNQACHHCHVEAGPKRTEQMTSRTADQVVELMAASSSVRVVDITGGAPELNSNFRRLVTEARALGHWVIDRCNLTILGEPGMEDLAAFLAANQVHVIASLPCYGPENVEKQRGSGVFDKSIEAIDQLNELGYGDQDSGLELDLVYNPVGAFLPPPQDGLEDDYRRVLGEQFGLRFNRLLTITNLPIKRFADFLEREGQLVDYMGLLINHFNPATVPGLMCRSLVSVGWDGKLYDCDFNQMLEMPLGSGRPSSPLSLWDLDTLDGLEGTPIATSGHCFGCTAGAGSSCVGALA